MVDGRLFIDSMNEYMLMVIVEGGAKVFTSSIPTCNDLPAL
jgi:hypothetical protein